MGYNFNASTLQRFNASTLPRASGLIAALLAVTTLAGCGGGGGSTTSTTPRPVAFTGQDFTAAAAQAQTGATAPAETLAQAQARGSQILARTDAMTATGLHLETNVAALSKVIIPSSCRGTTCTFTLNYRGTRVSESVSVEDFEYAPDIGVVLTKHGITTIKGREGPGFRSYGAWMDHAGFAVNTRAQQTVRNVTGTYRYAYAAGDTTGTRPTATATWRGLMVGTGTTGARKDDILQGDADLTFDATDNRLDATFDNIQNLDDRTDRISDIRFTNVPVDTDGGFQQDNGLSDYISGTFAGSEHQEAFGVFEKNAIAGAFGAKKE